MKECPYLLMLMKLWNGYWENHIDQMHKNFDEDNERGGTQENRKFWKLWWFSRNGLWKNSGCLLSEPTFGLGSLIMWEKDPKISGNKRKRSSIRLKVGFY